MRDHRSLAWQQARFVVGLVLKACRLHWKPAGAAVFDQLQRAALSVQLNIAEGYAFRGGNRWTNHLSIAYASAVETAELLELGIEEGLLPQELMMPAVTSSHRCQGLLLGLLKRARGDDGERQEGER